MKLKLLLAMVMSLALMAAVACGEDEEDATAVPTTAAVAPTAAPSAPTAPTAAPSAPTAPTARPAAAVPTTAPAMAMSKLPPAYLVDPSTAVPPGTVLQDPQEMIVPEGHSGTAVWRGGGSSFLSWTLSTLYISDGDDNIVPNILISHTASDDFKTWTFKLRDDAVFQDGTPLTAGDIKELWEHGAKPENIVAWGGHSMAVGDLAGWDELRAGDVTESEGLTVIDDQTIEMSLVNPFAPWAFNMVSAHGGMVKMEQVLSGDNEWTFHPIGVGPYKLTTNPDTNVFVVEASDDVAYWGGSPIIQKIHGLNITDRQVQAIMFENGETDLWNSQAPEYEAAIAPDHHLNKMILITPAASLWYIKVKFDITPLDDLLVRKALAHGTDMAAVVPAVWGKSGATIFANGILGPVMDCHQPQGAGHAYDPELARQELASSQYGGPDNLPTLFIDLSRPFMVNMGVATKEYWKDNLGIDLDLLKRERGMPRRPEAQFYRISTGSGTPDPTVLLSFLARTDSIESLSNIPGGFPVMDALVLTARGLAVDDPGRCPAWQAVENEYMEKVYMIPIRWDPIRTWFVQPWLKNFEMGLLRRWHTLPWMYVTKH